MSKFLQLLSRLPSTCLRVPRNWQPIPNGFWLCHEGGIPLRSNWETSLATHVPETIQCAKPSTSTTPRTSATQKQVLTEQRTSADVESFRDDTFESFVTAKPRNGRNFSAYVSNTAEPRPPYIGEASQSNVISSKPESNAPKFLSHSILSSTPISSLLFSKYSHVTTPGIIRCISTKPKAQQYVKQAKIRMKAWAVKRMGASRLFWAKKRMNLIKRTGKGRNRLKTLLSVQRHRLDNVQEKMKNRQQELHVLNERVKEKSEQV